RSSFFHSRKILQYNYSTTLKDSFNFSLCSQCNNELSKLKSAKKKLFSNSNSVKNKIDASKSRISKKIKLDLEICDLTSENESVQNSLDFSESNDDSEEDTYYTKG
ncbi:42_t:CDS:1, partial [Racocetra persica]